MPHKQEHTIDFNTTDFKSHIVNTIIKPNYIDEIHDSTENRTMWKKRAMRFETCSKLFIGVGSIMSFASGVYGYQTLSFVSGAISTISLVFLQYANFSYKESKKATSDLNILLDNIGIKKVPELNTATQDEQPMFKSVSPPQQQTPNQGSGYTIMNTNIKTNPNTPRISEKEDNYEEYKNPINEEHKKRIKYEELCYQNKFEEIKRMYEEDNFPLTELVLVKAAKEKNLEMFKYFLSTTISEINWDTIFYITLSGIEYIKAFYESDKYVIDLSSVKGALISPLRGAIMSNDIESVKYIYEKYHIIEEKDLKEAETLNNKEIIEFLSSKKSLN
jgi:hypothetical protein